MKSPIRTYLITALHECLAIFTLHMLDLYSNHQVLFHHIRLCSITCFLVNNQHFITYSNCIIQPLQKLHMELNAIISKFFL